VHHSHHSKAQPLSTTSLLSSLEMTVVSALPESVSSQFPPSLSNLRSNRPPNLAHLLVVCVHAFQFRHMRLVHSSDGNDGDNDATTGGAFPPISSLPQSNSAAFSAKE
jgi:hypothetical protein